MPPAAGGGGMDALPDEVLPCILGFLEAHEAVRTCVLDKRWRHLWRYATGLRVVVDKGEFLGSVEKAWEFLAHLLPLREGSPLRTCELRFGALGFYGTDGLFDDDGTRRVNTWFWHAITHGVQDLRLSTFTYADYWLRLDDMPLKSQHLTRLEFDGVEVYSSFLNFSSCPALEYLRCNDCKLAYNISSKSLKHLIITWCTFWFDSRIHICAPNLVSLRLSDYFGHTPVLGSMPSLVEAFISVIEDPAYSCEWHEVSSPCEFCDNSYDIGVGDGTTGSNSGMLLRGLSEARNLTLKSRPNPFIFKWDLKWCPTFSKLKTLLLNDYWCVPNDFRALAHLLECSPVLEKVTLELSSKTPQSKMSIKGDFRLMEGSAAISEHLKLVEVKCKVVDQRILKLVFFLCAFNIRLSLE